jgi:hypothetical protein
MVPYLAILAAWLAWQLIELCPRRWGKLDLDRAPIWLATVLIAALSLARLWEIPAPDNQLEV